MSEIEIRDNLAYPSEKEIIKFEGKEPFKIYDNMWEILRQSLEITSVPIIEREMKWDATDVNKSFYVKWTAEKKMDRWTKIDITLVAKGSQNSNTRNGNVTIAIKPLFITEVEVGFLQRIFWWIYYYIYYKKKRYNDFYYSKTIVNKLKKNIADLYGIEISESQ